MQHRWEQVGIYLILFHRVSQYLQHWMKKEAKLFSPGLVSPDKSRKQSSTLPLIQSQYGEWSPDASLPKIKSKQAIQKSIHNIYSTEKSKSKPVVSRSRLQLSFQQKYEWVHQESDYSQLRDDQIKQQNEKLRKALKGIDHEVDEMMNSVSSKIEKNLNRIQVLNNRSRAKTDGSLLAILPPDIQHRKEIQSREGINNEFILKLCKKEYMRLKKREKFIIGQNEVEEKQKSNTVVMALAHSRCKQRLQTSIDETISSIAKTKEVNKKIQYKNKTLGNSIHATDEFIDYMKKLQFQVEFQQKNKLKLERRLQQCERSMTEIHRKLYDIKAQSDLAEQYLQQHSKKDKDKEQVRAREQDLRKKQQEKKLKDKKKQLQFQSKQVAYHNLLVNLNDLKESIKNIDNQVGKVQGQNLALKVEQKELEKKLEKIKMLRKSISNQAKIGLMLLSNELIDDNHQEIKSEYSIPINQSNGIAKQESKKTQNYLTGKIHKPKNQPVQIQTQPEEKKIAVKFKNDSDISSIKQHETQNSPIKNAKNLG